MRNSYVTFTTTGSMFEVAKWYRRSWLWLKRLLGFGEILIINGEPRRIKKVVNSCQVMLREKRG